MARMATVLFTQLLDRESEVGVGEGFVLQGEVPPLGIERLETVTEHGLTQNHTVLELLGRKPPPNLPRLGEGCLRI